MLETLQDHLNYLFYRLKEIISRDDRVYVVTHCLSHHTHFDDDDNIKNNLEVYHFIRSLSDDMTMITDINVIEFMKLDKERINVIVIDRHPNSRVDQNMLKEKFDTVIIVPDFKVTSK